MRIGHEFGQPTPIHRDWLKSFHQWSLNLLLIELSRPKRALGVLRDSGHAHIEWCA